MVRKCYYIMWFGLSIGFGIFEHLFVGGRGSSSLFFLGEILCCINIKDIKITMSSTKEQEKPKESLLMSLAKPFFVGSISGVVATSVIQPVDCVKVMIQSKKEAAGKTKVNLSPFAVASEIIKNDGVKGLYKGLDSAILRQVIYCGIRLGLFRAFEDDIKSKHSRSMTFGEKVGYSLLAGLIGSAIANPLDMALIRFQSDSSLPLEERRNYKNVFDALGKMNKELKFFGMWRGSIPTMTRAMAINMFTLVAYTEVKQLMQKRMNETKETTFIRLFGSAIAGVSASVGSLPFDNIKTKILKMKPNKQGELPYKNIIDCFSKSVKNEGFTSLWVGLPTFYFRVAPHAMISILIQDYLHDFLNKNKSKE